MRRHLVEQSKIERVDLKTDRILLLRRQRDPEFRPSPSGVESYAHGSEEYSKPFQNRPRFVLEIFEKNSYSWV